MLLLGQGPLCWDHLEDPEYLEESTNSHNMINKMSFYSFFALACLILVKTCLFYSHCWSPIFFFIQQ